MLETIKFIIGAVFILGMIAGMIWAFIGFLKDTNNHFRHFLGALSGIVLCLSGVVLFSFLLVKSSEWFIKPLLIMLGA